MYHLFLLYDQKSFLTLSFKIPLTKLRHSKTLKSEASVVKITCLLGIPSFVTFFKFVNSVVFLINNYIINSRRT